MMRNLWPYLAIAISARDLYQQVYEICDKSIPIPSVQWLRLQFWPSSTSTAAQKNTGRVKIKMPVSARQHRKHHPDTLSDSEITFVCEDDKHTIKIEESNVPVAAVERRRQVVVGLDQKMVIGDHDFSRVSLSPSLKGKNVQVFSTASGDEMKDMADQLKKIDEEFCSDILLDPDHTS
ncbi:hypothetical protein HOLleu_15799 [Holothuria leucospilota]|uniref:Uncharacterized protein n=1 Tax=Holothuria leucospilota TaxID=206669 RepID=A0A9Q1H9W4_HOLLE|nr:hypothetical protein HOLleu_15799 [Holothuria leucospilota]